MDICVSWGACSNFRQLFSPSDNHQSVFCVSKLFFCWRFSTCDIITAFIYVCLTSLSIMASRSIHIIANGKTSFFLMATIMKNCLESSAVTSMCIICQKCWPAVPVTSPATRTWSGWPTLCYCNNSHMSFFFFFFCQLAFGLFIKCGQNWGFI